MAIVVANSINQEIVVIIIYLINSVNTGTCYRIHSYISMTSTLVWSSR
jgi:hypothetical protein